jgi:hypothetical protein
VPRHQEPPLPRWIYAIADNRIMDAVYRIADPIQRFFVSLASVLGYVAMALLYVAIPCLVLYGLVRFVRWAWYN